MAGAPRPRCLALRRPRKLGGRTFWPRKATGKSPSAAARTSLDRLLRIGHPGSGDPFREILRRQQRYREAGVGSLWLLRQPSFPITRELPAALISGSPEEGFAALIPSDSGHQALPMREFLDAVFSKRFRFGVPVGAEATVSVRAGSLWCWSCGAETTIITGVDVAFGAHELSFTIAKLGEYAQPLQSVLSRLPSDLEVGSIKSRFNRTQSRSYVSNGCFHLRRAHRRLLRA